VNVPVWAAEIARAFWSQVWEPEVFPRRLIRPISEATCLSVAYASRPTIDTIQRRLRNLGINYCLSLVNRPLRACIVAGDGHGLIFVDGTDSENEQRFSIAHELAHFLHDYVYPRRKVLNRVGNAALDVLDGLRLPTTDERIHALLTRTGLGFYFHLMDRGEREYSLPGPIADAEKSADRLAYELLAPAQQVASLVSLITAHPNQTIVADLLMDQFGFPEQQAMRYSALLVARPRRTDPLLQRLRSV
jgi:hypothetical protein